MSAARFWLWFGGIWLAAGLPILVAGLYGSIEHRRLSARFEAEGRTTDGIVLTKSISTSANRENRSPKYRTTFRFTTTAGVVTGEAELTANAWDALVEREPIQVTYLPDAPELHRVEGQTNGWLALALMAALGGMFATLGAVVLARASRIHRTRARLLRDGVAAEATLVDVQPSRMRINHVSQWSLHYRYRDGRGTTHTGSETVSPEEADTWAAGETGTIRYDRRRPDVSVWIGKP